MSLKKTKNKAQSSAYYRQHLFFCVNQRADGEKMCCANFDAQAMRDYAKKRCKAKSMHQKGEVRVNMAGCLGRCQEGPVVVVYPEGVWYTWVDQEDIDEIIEQHLFNGKIVERLRLGLRMK